MRGARGGGGVEDAEALRRELAADDGRGRQRHQGGVTHHLVRVDAVGAAGFLRPGERGGQQQEQNKQVAHVRRPHVPLT
ncbi:hypothetical protein GCM10012319_53270 [Comamonas sp. KCTC 72670]|nr:hypothetical protein GCM10012319_53270 [Comamonas sp. KCTC 72670]